MVVSLVLGLEIGFSGLQTIFSLTKVDQNRTNALVDYIYKKLPQAIVRRTADVRCYCD